MTDEHPTPDAPETTDPPKTETLVVQALGRSWEVPASGDDWPFAAALAAEQGRSMSFLDAVLSPADRQRLRTFTGGQAADLFHAVIAAMGAKSAGESPAS